MTQIGTHSPPTKTERWPRVTRRNPCPICEQDHWCKTTEDGAIAGCMRVEFGAYRTVDTDLGPMYLHRLSDEPREMPPPRPSAPEAPQRNTIADHAVFALVVGACAPLPDFAEAELLRRFGPYWRAIATARHIGYCDGPVLLAAIEAAGRQREAIAAGVLNGNGSVSRSLLGRLVIPYFRDGQVHDLRGSGIKGRGETKELSLRGGYAERGVADLFYNHDALASIGPDDTLHIAGGAYKTMALIAAGLRAVGLRGEAELSDGHIAALHAVGVTATTLHIDSEDPKEGQQLSAGRRLGLAKAEKLAVGFAVAVAEPPHEPGTPKVDPDALLRDLGPRAVRDYALSAIPLAAWRVVIGVESPGPPPEFVARLDRSEERERKATRMLANVIQVRRNAAIKAERDTLVASVLHMGAEQANGRVTPGGRIRQPLYIPANAAGVANKTASRHLSLAPENDLFDRQILREEVVRHVDEATGERRNILRLLDERDRVIEECPAEIVFGPTGAPPARSADGDDGGKAYYVLPLHEPDVILDRLVNLDPVKIAKDGTVKKTWGGKREPCPRCGSQRRRTVVTCADCQLEFSNSVSAPQDLPEPETVADVSPRRPAPPSIPATPVVVAEPVPTYPAGQIRYQATASGPVKVDERDDPADEPDDWDPYECNHPGRTSRPVIGQRWCGPHRAERRAAVGASSTAPPAASVGAAAFTLGGVRHGPPKAAAPPLDPAVAEGIARRNDGQTIAARLGGFQARWDGGERTEDLTLLVAEWRQIAEVRRALDAQAVR